MRDGLEGGRCGAAFVFGVVVCCTALTNHFGCCLLFVASEQNIEHDDTQTQLLNSNDSFLKTRNK